MSRQFTKLPGFCDVHVHLRDPGFPKKETIKTGSIASAHGGYVDVCAMPNTSPICDCEQVLDYVTNTAIDDSAINIWQYCAITVGQRGKDLVDMHSLSDKCIAFSDDGVGVANSNVMEAAMKTAVKAGKMIVAHCEDKTLVEDGGCIHDGSYAAEHGHVGISSASEYKQVERDLELAAKTGCKYHVCHVSTKQSVEAIATAKADGVNVTCETAPHYLVLCEDDLQEDGRFKMNPPLRSAADRDALINGVKQGVIDCIATDHAPHTSAEKAKGLDDSLFGITGIELSFPVLYTYLVKTGTIDMDTIIKCLTSNARERFEIPEHNISDTYSLWDLDAKFTPDESFFLSKGKSSPFTGVELYGVNQLTVFNGVEIYKK